MRVKCHSTDEGNLKAREVKRKWGEKVVSRETLLVARRKKVLCGVRIENASYALARISKVREEAGLGEVHQGRPYGECGDFTNDGEERSFRVVAEESGKKESKRSTPF